MNVPDDLRYAESHEWVRVEGGNARVGITDHAQAELTDVVYVELPKIGAKATAKNQIAVVESVKAASDIYAPVSGEVTDVNKALGEKPETVNSNPHESWMIAIKVSGGDDDLLDATQYAELTK